MRVIAHLISVALLLPALVVATAFLALDHVLSQLGWFAFFVALMHIALAALPWAFLACALLITLSVLGFSERYRWAAALCVAGMAIASSAVLAWIGDFPATPVDAGFFVPGAAALAISVWIAVSEWPARRDA
ncbi:MAG: hypothetical protein ABI854_07395 [Betaproteobacteria bacterium]